MWDVALTLIILLFFPIIVGVLIGFIIHWWLELRALGRQIHEQP